MSAAVAVAVAVVVQARFAVSALLVDRIDISMMVMMILLLLLLLLLLLQQQRPVIISTDLVFSPPPPSLALGGSGTALLSLSLSPSIFFSKRHPRCMGAYP